MKEEPGKDFNGRPEGIQPLVKQRKKFSNYFV